MKKITIEIPDSVLSRIEDINEEMEGGSAAKLAAVLGTVMLERECRENGCMKLTEDDVLDMIELDEKKGISVIAHTIIHAVAVKAGSMTQRAKKEGNATLTGSVPQCEN